MGQYYETFDPPFFMERRYAFDAIAENPRGFDRLDEEIIEALQKRFSSLNGIDVSQIAIGCEKQIVTLKGQVATPRILSFLGRIADQILGVRKVDNQLFIARSGAVANVMDKNNQNNRPSQAPQPPQTSTPRVDF